MKRSVPAQTFNFSFHQFLVSSAFVSATGAALFSHQLRQLHQLHKHTPKLIWKNNSQLMDLSAHICRSFRSPSSGSQQPLRLLFSVVIPSLINHKWIKCICACGWLQLYSVYQISIITGFFALLTDMYAPNTGHRHRITIIIRLPY